MAMQQQFVQNAPMNQTDQNHVNQSGVQMRQNVPRAARTGSVSLLSGDPNHPPQFIEAAETNLVVPEGEPIHLSMRVTPASDPSLRIEWFRNGNPISAGCRVVSSFERGYAVLDILYTIPDDTGEYVCVASSAQGSATSAPSLINIIPEEPSVQDDQIQEESLLHNMAGTPSINDQPSSSHGPPQFLKPLAPQTDLRENAPAHFEIRVAPGNDPTLGVEWYKNDTPLSSGSRFALMYDRGYASLDILYCFPEDSGNYFCVAKNSAGQVQSNVVPLSCIPDATVITSSTLSTDAVHYLEGLDHGGYEQLGNGEDFRYREHEEVDVPPTFDIQPLPQSVLEGSPARFLVKIGGNPRPRVQWFINGDVVVSTSQWRIYHDGAINYLEFHRCSALGEFHIKVVAKNKLGEASAESMLIVSAPDDFRPDLKHIEPDNPFMKIVSLKKVDRTPELNDALKKPKAQAVQLRKVERESETKGRETKENDTLETENLYLNVQSKLKTRGDHLGFQANSNPTG